MGVQDVANLPSKSSGIVVEVNASGPPLIKTMLGISKGMLPVKRFLYSKFSFFCMINLMEIIKLPQS